jgi:signal transduction histidine kinase
MDRILTPRERARLDLKSYLTVRIGAAGALCLLAAAAIALAVSYRDVKRLNDETAHRALDTLEKQLAMGSSISMSDRFPDWDGLVDLMRAAGQCLYFRTPVGGTARSSCMGADPTAAMPPAWFLAAYRELIAPGTDVILKVDHRGQTRGEIVVATDPVSAAARVWERVVGLLGLSALTTGAICALAYLVIGRALAPTKEVLAGFDRLAQGDLAVRLPSFRLMELQRISEVFNGLAEGLQRTTSERQALAAKLVNAVEQERRRLAREIHDELAQNLSAVGALAASITATAEKECPPIAVEARRLTETATSVLKSLRRALHELRPQEIDDLGLSPSLASLVADYERRLQTDLRISLAIEADFSDLPPTASAHVYRIVQEGLTNVTKHADATSAKVILRFCDNSADNAMRSRRFLEIEIVDDGRGLDTEVSSGGMGLIGMRERVAALGGTLEVANGNDRGSKLTAIIPVPVRGDA